MYVYKPMAGHNLMQAIARVNRVFGEKEGGLTEATMINCDAGQALGSPDLRACPADQIGAGFIMLLC